MNIKELIKKLIMSYFIIFTIVVTSLSVLRQIFIPDKSFELKDMFIYMLGSLLGDLPTLIFYSPREVSERGMRIRIVIHFVVLEVVLLTFGRVIGVVNGAINMIVFAVQIAVIYLLVRFFNLLYDKKEANSINERLTVMKNSSTGDTEQE